MTVDGASFDRLSRRLAAIGSRRRAVKAVAGATIAALVAGRENADAQSCTPTYRACSGDGQCCAGAVCQHGMCTPGCRIGGSFVSARTPELGNICARCTPELSTTSWSPANDGIACWSATSSLCGAGSSTCREGACRPASQITCQPLTTCHQAGTCNPGTGLCSHPPAEAGTPCGGGEMCLGGFYSPGLVCNGSGACVGGQTVPCAPYTCDDSRCRTFCEDDSHCTGGTRCREGVCAIGNPNGWSCETDSDCTSEHCVAGVCCNERCASGCSICTTGACLPKVCPEAEFECATASCDEATGACVSTPNEGHCLIFGTCHQAGARWEVNPCFECDPSRNPGDWSFVECTTTLPCTIAFCNPDLGGLCDERDLGC